MSKWLSIPSKTLIILLITIVLSACDRGKKPYEEAEALFNKSEYAAAKKKAAEASLNTNSKYHDRAKALYEKIEKMEDSIKQVNEAVQIGDYTTAIKSYEEILVLDSNNALTKEALPIMREAYQRKGKLLEDGNAFIESGEYDKAEKTYREILTLNDVS